MRSRRLLFSPFLVLTVMFSIVANECYASVAPFWLWEGAYAYYEFEVMTFTFWNHTSLWNAKGTYGWKCLGVTGKTATLQITVNITGGKFEPDFGEFRAEPYAFAGKFEINIDMETREAFIDNEPLGVLPYWIPTDVNKTDVINSLVSLGNRTLLGRVGSVRPDIETSYKTFSGDELLAVANQYEPDKAFFFLYEKDSGLMVISSFLDNIWREKIGIFQEAGSELPYGFLHLKDANIEFRPEPTSPLSLLLPYIITATAITSATIFIYFIKIRKKS